MTSPAATIEPLRGSRSSLAGNLDPIMSSRRFKTGIIGIGRIGFELPDNHETAYHFCPYTELVAVCDTNEVFLRGLVEAMGLRGYVDYRVMVQTEELDIVSVCTPPETHAQIVCDIAPYVKAILCEKPIATTLEDADRMIETCKKHKTLLMINHQREFTDPVFRFSRGILNTGTHLFSEIMTLFGPIDKLLPDGVVMLDGRFIGIEEVGTDEPVFDLKITHERMIPKVVAQIVENLKHGETWGNALKARLALEYCLKYKELKERTSIR